MAYEPTKGPFWAGGNADGWFVRLHKEPDYVPNDGPTDIQIRWFNTRDFAKGELGAALAAEELVADLNAAMMGEPLLKTLTRARLALVYASDCMGNCGDKHADGREVIAREYEIINDVIRATERPA